MKSVNLVYHVAAGYRDLVFFNATGITHRRQSLELFPGTYESVSEFEKLHPHLSIVTKMPLHEWLNRSIATERTRNVLTRVARRSSYEPSSSNYVGHTKAIADGKAKCLCVGKLRNIMCPFHGR